MKTEEVIIASKDYRIRHHDDGTKDVQIEGFDGKWYSIHKRVPEFINLGWCYIIKDGDQVDLDHEFWSDMARRILGSTRFEANGKIGCLKNQREVVPAIFDQIEFLKSGRLFLRGGDRCYLISCSEGGKGGPFSFHNSKYYENDMVGWRGEGEVVIPARYDDVNKIWGLDVYETVKDRGYRYLNGKGEEILTQEKEAFGIGQDEPYPESIYFRRRNDSNRICLQHLCAPDPSDDEVFLTDDGKHVSLLGISHDNLVETLCEGCTDLVIDDKALEGFNNDFSYEFSGYLAFSESSSPLMDCMRQFKELGAHGNTWHYIFKIITAKGSAISPEELRTWRHYLESELEPRFLSYTIGLGESDDLKPGEVNVIMITYYNERCWPSDYELNWIDDSMTATLEELKEKEKSLKKSIMSSVKKEYREEVLEDQYKVPFWNIRYTGRSWKETEKVLNYLAERFPGYKTFTHSFIGHLEIPFFNDDTDILDQMRFSANVLKWAAKKGCDFNLIEDGQTVLDRLYGCLNMQDCSKERKMVINEVTPFLIRMGARTLKQLREEESRIEPDYNDEIERLEKLCGK